MYYLVQFKTILNQPYLSNCTKRGPLVYFKDFRGLKIISKIVHCGVVGEEVEDEEEEETIAVLAVVAAVVLAEELKMLQGFIK